MLELVQQYKRRFEDTIRYRLSTSPNPHNHSLMLSALLEGKWEEVDSLMSLRAYQRQFEGVVICMAHVDYDEEFTLNDHLELMEAWYAKVSC